jgi:dUTPase
MNTKPVKVKVLVLPGGVMPEKGRLPSGEIDPDNVGFDVTARGVVSLRQWVPERSYERRLIFDFKKLPEGKLSESTRHAGLTSVIDYGSPHAAKPTLSLKFTIGAMLYFGAGFVLDMPKGMHAVISSRGSTVEKGFKILNGDSPIDRGFGGEPVMAVHNWTSWFQEIGPNDLKLGQLIFPGYSDVTLIPAKSFAELEVKPCGNGNHGSTDRPKKKM